MNGVQRGLGRSSGQNGQKNLDDSAGLGLRIRTYYPNTGESGASTDVTNGTFPADFLALKCVYMATPGKAKNRCMQCEMPEDRCECEKFCVLCQSQIDVRICTDGLMYCPACREACDYKVE